MVVVIADIEVAEQLCLPALAMVLAQQNGRETDTPPKQLN